MVAAETTMTTIAVAPVTVAAEMMTTTAAAVLAIPGVGMMITAPLLPPATTIPRPRPVVVMTTAGPDGLAREIQAGETTMTVQADPAGPVTPVTTAPVTVLVDPEIPAMVPAMTMDPAGPADLVVPVTGTLAMVVPATAPAVLETPVTLSQILATTQVIPTPVTPRIPTMVTTAVPAGLRPARTLVRARAPVPVPRPRPAVSCFSKRLTASSRAT